MLKGDVDPNQRVGTADEEEEDQDVDEEDNTMEHPTKLSQIVASPASIHLITSHHISQVTSEMTHHITQVTHQVQRILGVATYKCVWLSLNEYIIYTLSQVILMIR